MKHTFLTLSCITFQNSQTHFENLVSNTARILKYVDCEAFQLLVRKGNRSPLQVTRLGQKK